MANDEGDNPVSPTTRPEAAHDAGEPRRIHYPLSLDTENIDERHRRLSPPPQGDPAHASRSDTEVLRKTPTNTTVPPASSHGGRVSGSADRATVTSPSPQSFDLGLRRRNTNGTVGGGGGFQGRARAATFRTVEDFDEFDGAYSARPGWQPGSEPGYDPELPDGGHASMPTLNAPCRITVVDFSLDHVQKRHFDNESFIDFIEKPKEDWAKCRWININGLSWDVIQAVGNQKGLHKLALEDVMNIRNRTKADWYPNHAFIIMTLQKLVHLVDEDDSTSSSSSLRSRKSMSMLRDSFKDLWRSRRASHHEAADLEKEEITNNLGNYNDYDNKNSTSGGRVPTFPDGTTLKQTSMLRSLQRYHASGNEARTEYMERHSSLAPYRMAVSAEQVSIFLTSDNTVISFFEVSAGDVERPIVTRLSTPGTILRESYDASLLVQAIIDAIIDLAIPLTAVYTDIIGDLELDVLTNPSMHQSRSLYICISEINKMLSFLNPIDNLVNVLRDHTTDMPQQVAIEQLENPATGVVVTPMTHTYLGDVLDHCIIITENLTQLKQSSDNLIDLIFNTITAGQNESMKQLTIVTIIFLPLTFITGFFGMNFPAEKFPEVNNGIWYL